MEVFCQICEHPTDLIEICDYGYDECEDGSYGRTHRHCMEGCLCTYGGCMPERELL